MSFHWNCCFSKGKYSFSVIVSSIIEFCYRVWEREWRKETGDAVVHFVNLNSVPVFSAPNIFPHLWVRISSLSPESKLLAPVSCLVVPDRDRHLAIYHFIYLDTLSSLFFQLWILVVNLPWVLWQSVPFNWTYLSHLYLIWLRILLDKSVLWLFAFSGSPSVLCSFFFLNSASFWIIFYFSILSPLLCYELLLSEVLF